jgi:hypothetical protein
MDQFIAPNIELERSRLPAGIGRSLGQLRSTRSAYRSLLADLPTSDWLQSQIDVRARLLNNLRRVRFHLGQHLDELLLRRSTRSGRRPSRGKKLHALSSRKGSGARRTSQQSG